jgi:hypothetical protein
MDAVVTRCAGGSQPPRLRAPRDIFENKSKAEETAKGFEMIGYLNGCSELGAFEKVWMYTVVFT